MSAKVYTHKPSLRASHMMAEASGEIMGPPLREMPSSSVDSSVTSTSLICVSSGVSSSCAEITTQNRKISIIMVIVRREAMKPPRQNTNRITLIMIT